MKPQDPWQELDDWAMAQPRKAERRYAATAKTMTIPLVQAQSIYGPLMLLALSKQMIEALYESVSR